MGPRAETLALSAAVALQGPFLAFLAGQSAAGYVVLSAAAGIAALGVAAALDRPRTGDKFRALALMASAGSLAMLLGWYADAGFRPLVGTGICLCGCPSSLAGLGLVSRLHWMQGCMLGACALATWATAPHRARSPGHARIGRRILSSSVLMLGGMAAAGWAVGILRFQSPASTLFASYLAMTAGMAAGSALAVRLEAAAPSLPSRPAGALVSGPHLP
jgi:hypothetical protein